ncbi:hypothetical protein BJV38_005000 [Clostridium beijerinckii]|uniref:hypothetical protein n=1 Tax=Clostridium beijerinckii TaxID=1520 RepID=UPI001570093E|nr:hypothetical protein [Clostridium beijerinckii]NRT32415.1 hypothetical protein [Clostridium beijerinckii]NRT48157.1 hypothetical protein [Clostridium beijerinckii]NRZ23546.1 hypothetical protein [Clostridium beijerinckii]
MKYTIEGFSQQALIEFNLDEKDALILRYFIDFKDSGKMSMKIINNKPFYWLKSASLLEELPIMKISSNDVLKRRLNKLTECKVLEHEHVKVGGRFAFYAVGENYYKLVTDDTTQKSEGIRPESRKDTTKKSEEYDSKVGTKNPSTNPSTKSYISCGTEKSDSTDKVPYEIIIDLFNSICKSLPRVKARNKTRDKHIKTMYKALGSDRVKELFALVESSDYLSGRNDKWLNCSFDWVIKESNYIKVLEGNYSRKQGNVIQMPTKNNEQNEIKFDTEKLGDL